MVGQVGVVQEGEETGLRSASPHFCVLTGSTNKQTNKEPKLHPHSYPEQLMHKDTAMMDLLIHFSQKQRRQQHSSVGN